MITFIQLNTWCIEGSGGILGHRYGNDLYIFMTAGDDPFIVRLSEKYYGMCLTLMQHV